MAKQFAIIGLGRFGKALALELSRMGHQVLAVDQARDLVEDVAQYVTQAIVCDVTEEDAFAALGVGNFDMAIIAIGGDSRASVFASLLAKESGVPLVVAKASDETHAKILRKVGVDKVIQPEHDMALRLAHKLSNSGVMDYMDVSEGFSFINVKAPVEWVGKSLVSINLRSKYGVNAVALRRNGKMLVNLDPNAPFMEDDAILLLGSNEKLAKLEMKFGKLRE